VSRRLKVVLALVACFVGGMVWTVITHDGGGDDATGDDTPAATAPRAPVAGPPVSARVPQPISLAVEGRLWALRAGRDPWPFQGSRGYLPVGWSVRRQWPTLAQAGTGHFWYFYVSFVLGLGVTASSAVFGAPFWFDLLQRLIQIRGTGAKPRTNRDEEKGVVTSAATP